MRTYNGKSRYSDDEMRTKVETLSVEEREDLIQKLGVSHLVFENWMGAKDKLVNSKVRNKCLHLLGMLMNYDEFKATVGI